MNIAVAQSGGPTAAINASLLGVVREALAQREIDNVYGAVNGIEGVINKNLIQLNSLFEAEDADLLRQTPATALGSCRYKLPTLEKDSEIYKKITDCFLELGIKAFFYIGGNDSMDTVHKLSEYFSKNNIDIRVMGVPKTIDNDLCETDHTPGFGSAAKFVATAIEEISLDSAVYNLKSVTIVEIMGRHAGWLAASACIPHVNGQVAPHLIYLPECEFSIEKFLEDIRNNLKKYNSVIVAVSEGIDLRNLDPTLRAGKVDAFGHQYLNGVGKCLENIVKTEIGCKVRSVELNVLQRSASHISSRTDIDEAQHIGACAVKAMLDGVTGKMMAFKRVSDNPYSVVVEPVDASLVANNERFFPKKWINDEQNNIKDEALGYFIPLIEGECNIKTKNGLPLRFNIQNILK